MTYGPDFWPGDPVTIEGRPGTVAEHHPDHEWPLLVTFSGDTSPRISMCRYDHVEGYR